jgi:protein SCO1/2
VSVPRRIIALSTASLLAGLLGACGQQTELDAADARERDTGYRGVILPDPVPKADFTLTDTDGRPFDFRRDTDGLVTLLFFGYTNCPDICPVHLGNIGRVLADQPYDVTSRIRVVFVTTDPERDTPDVIRAWLDAFDPSFIGLTGDVETINKAQIAMGMPQAIRDSTVNAANGGYGVGHSAQVLAFSPDGYAHVTYPFGTRQIDWVHDLPKLVRDEWSDR